MELFFFFLSIPQNSKLLVTILEGEKSNQHILILHELPFRILYSIDMLPLYKIHCGDSFSYLFQN